MDSYMSAWSQRNHLMHGGSNNEQYNAKTINITNNRSPSEAPPQPSSSVPFTRDPNFVERSEYHQLCHKLQSGKTRVALVGLGGVGKSQLAIEYCYHLRDRSPETWVFWVHASNNARLEEGVRDVADILRLPGREDPQINVFRLVHEWLRSIENKWLLVLDNADTEDVLFTAPDLPNNVSTKHEKRWLIDFLSIPANGQTILTTRSDGVASRYTDPHGAIQVGPMERMDAISLFCKRTEQQQDGSSIGDLVEVLGCIPLAVAQAAAFTMKAVPPWSARKYLNAFKASIDSRDNLLSANNHELRRDPGAANSVIVTWQISFEHIRRERPSAANRLSLMCFYDHRSIPDSLLHIEPAATSLHQADSPARLNSSIQQFDLEDDPVLDQNLQGDLRTLLDFRLVSIGPNHSTYEMHPLVQLPVQKWLESHDRREMWLGFAIRTVDREFPDDVSCARQPICQFMQPHANLLSHHKPQKQHAILCWASMLYKLAGFQLQWGSAVVGEVFAMNSASARECILGKDHEDSLNSMILRANLIRGQGSYNDAEYMIRRTLDIRAAAFGRDHHDTLQDSLDLLSILLDTQKYEAAEVLGYDLLQLHEKKLGATSGQTLSARQKYATALGGLGKNREAEGIYRQVLAVQTQKFGESDISTLITAQGLAATLRKLGHLDEAVQIHQRVLEAKEDLFGFEYVSTPLAAYSLAISLYEKGLEGNMKEAERLMQRVVKGAKRTIEEQHPDTLTFLHQLAFIKQDMGLYEEALDLMILCVENSKQVWGVDHERTTKAIRLMEQAKSALERERNEDQAREHKGSKKRKRRRKAHKLTPKRTEKPVCVVQ